MHRLLLLRHAKAGWATAGSPDRERPLTERGVDDAIRLGKLMRTDNLVPQMVLCSTALRTRQTWDAVSSAIPGPAGGIFFEPGLYNSDAADYLEAIRFSSASGPLLVIGHNPMMEDLTFALARDGEAEALHQVGAGFPTCGLAVLDCDVPLSELTQRKAHLKAFIRPSRH